MIGVPGISLARQQSVDRFVKRFNRDIDEPDEVSERHLILRRLILKKLKDVSSIFQLWH